VEFDWNKEINSVSPSAILGRERHFSTRTHSVTEGADMKKNRCRKSLAVAAEFILMAAVLTRAQSGSHGPAQSQKVTSSEAYQKRDSLPADDFAGLTYSDEQKAEIDKIHQDTKMRRDAVARDERLNADQKDAMLQGYTRIEYRRVYGVLTPEQQMQVRQKIRNRRGADQAAQKQQTPRSQN
jgi:hypothetical protein